MEEKEKKKKGHIRHQCGITSRHLQVQAISTAIMEVTAPLRTTERASLDSCKKVRIIIFFRNGTIDEHGRERQQSEKARCNAQSCIIEKPIQECISEMRDQSTENNDDKSEEARHSYRKKKR